MNKSRFFKSQKHFNLRLLKSHLSDMLAESKNGSVTVVQCQPLETKGLIKINHYNDKERIIYFHSSPSLALLTKSSGNRKLESEAPGNHEIPQNSHNQVGASSTRTCMS